MKKGLYIASFVVSLISSLFPYIPIFIENTYGINSLFYFIILSLSFPYAIFVVIVNKILRKTKYLLLLSPFFLSLTYVMLTIKNVFFLYLSAIFFGIYTSLYWLPRHALLITEGGYEEKEMSKFYIIPFLIKSTSFLFIAFLIEHLGFVFTFALLSLLSPIVILISPRKHYEVRIYEKKEC